MRLFLVVACMLFAFGCAEPVDAVRAEPIVDCSTGTESLASGAWAPGTKLAIELTWDFPCSRELGWAKDKWRKLGVEFHDQYDDDVTLIPMHYDPDMEMGGHAVWLLRPMTGRIHSGEIWVRECNWTIIAHEMGHVLGFAAHADREGALMNGWLSGDEVSPRELASLWWRTDHPGEDMCAPGVLDEAVTAMEVEQ